jgi:hypothetical protein
VCNSGFAYINKQGGKEHPMPTTAKERGHLYIFLFYEPSDELNNFFYICKCE